MAETLTRRTVKVLEYLKMAEAAYREGRNDQARTYLTMGTALLKRPNAPDSATPRDAGRGNP